MEGPYADHLLDASDVCSNCLALTRQERVDPVRGSLTRELDASLERDPRRTSVEFGPHEIPSRSKGVFCECGVEGVHERLWNPDDVGEGRFRELLKRAIATLEEKDVTIRRKRAIGHALQAYRHGDDVDEALAAGIEAGIVAAVAAGDMERAEA